MTRTLSNEFAHTIKSFKEQLDRIEEQKLTDSWLKGQLDIYGENLRTLREHDAIQTDTLLRIDKELDVFTEHEEERSRQVAVINEKVSAVVKAIIKEGLEEYRAKHPVKKSKGRKVEKCSEDANETMWQPNPKIRSTYER